MKKVYFLLINMMLFCSSLIAQAPQGISYQAVIRNSQNKLISNSLIGTKLSILQGSSESGIVVYCEKQTTQSNNNGLITLIIGQGTIVKGIFEDINWANGPYFLKTETDPDGGNNYNITSTTQFLSVPFAFHAQTAQTVAPTSFLAPATTIMPATNVQSFSATLNGKVNGNGFSTNVVFLWGLTTDYGNEVIDTTITGTNDVNVNTNLNGIISDTTYHYQIKATNAVNTSYSSDMSFTTLISIPQLSTVAISSITGASATSGGTITNDGGANITNRGICWNTSSNPTIENSKTSDSIGLGSYTSYIIELLPITTYYVRAYATNCEGTAYGNEVSFTTKPVLPMLTTTATSAISSISATSGGNISYDGGANVTVRGICWGTTQNPTTSNSKTFNGTGSGTFISLMQGLTPGTTYYIRAYATNSEGTAYGEEISFTTKAVLPTLTTSALSDITSTTATSGGNITYDGGANVTVRGICWSISQNPTISNSKTINGTGTGTYISSITGLLPYTTYYARAFATNSAGTAYGDEYRFITHTVETVTDIDGNIYNTCTIGSQVWMIENLRTTNNNEGESIPWVVNRDVWIYLSTPAYCGYTSSENSILYNWYSVETGKLCPIGWHVPSKEEWSTLIDYLTNNGYGYEGSGNDVAKSMANTSSWQIYSTPGTPGYDPLSNNRCGFNANATGYRKNTDGRNYEGGESAIFWSSTNYDSSRANVLELHYNDKMVVINHMHKNCALSVRCVKD